MNGYIYAVGGFDGQNQLRTVERYNPKENKWEFVSSLLKARSGVGVAVINNKLFALGEALSQIFYNKNVLFLLSVLEV